VDDGGDDDAHVAEPDERPCVTVYDDSTGRFALTSSASAADLDCVSFDAWLRRFAAEAAQTRSIVAAVQSDRQAAHETRALPHHWLPLA
jgi:hypothetical protein